VNSWECFPALFIYFLRKVFIVSTSESLNLSSYEKSLLVSFWMENAVVGHMALEDDYIREQVLGDKQMSDLGLGAQCRALDEAAKYLLQRLLWDRDASSEWFCKLLMDKLQQDYEAWDAEGPLDRLEALLHGIETGFGKYPSRATGAIQTFDKRKD